MANDPERDILPVKDGALCEKQRHMSTFSLNSERDKLQSSYISKINRKELEDRYMCLVVDNSHLKRECNKQEEKIKRLATKLLRLVAEQKRDLPTAAQRRDHDLGSLAEEQEQQIRELQQSNGLLQDRLTVLRNQLMEHAYMHSAAHCNWMRKSRPSSRSPVHSQRQTLRTQNASPSPHSSQHTVQPNSRSDPVDHRSKGPAQALGTEMIEDHQGPKDKQRPPDVPDSNVAVTPQNRKPPEEIMRLHEQIRILEQGLETQREQNSARILELEDELANTVAQSQRQKVAENIEMIRLQRSIQQQSASLAAQSAKNQVLECEVTHLHQELETKQQNFDELHHQLMNEHRKVADLQQELQRVTSNCLSVRELQEQIRDIQNERSALKEHNERLLALLSSRQIEVSEREGALHSKVSQLESMLSKEQSERALLLRQTERLQLEVAQLEAALSTERKERSSLLESQNVMYQKMPEPQLSSDTENALRLQVTQLETELAKEMGDRAQILQSTEEETIQVAALKAAHSDLLVKCQNLQAQHDKLENQLRSLQQDPRNQDSFDTPVPGPSVLPSHSLLRVPTLKQSQLAQTLHKRLIFKPGNRLPVSSSALFAADRNDRHSESDSQISQLLCSERRLSETSITDTGWRKSAMASKQECSLQGEPVSSCECDQDSRTIAEGFSACSKVPSQSVNSCQGCEDLMHINDRQEHTVGEILMTIEEHTNISQNGRTALSLDSQLEENDGEKSLCEDGDDSSRLKTPGQDSYQTDELNMMDSHPGDDKNMIANQLDTRRELDKCLGLLRVQYHLNSMYKKEVASIAQQLAQSEDDHANKMDEMSRLLQKHTAHITELQSRLKTSESHLAGHLTLGVGEGLFEIHIQRLQLSPEGLGSLVDQHSDTKELPFIFLTWEFYDQDVAYTSVKAAESCMEFDSSSVHRVTVNDKFRQYLEEGVCAVEVHVAVDDSSETVAKGSLDFSDIFRFPEKKFHSTVPIAGTRNHEAICEFGVIECWFMLNCSVSLVNSFIQHRTAKKVRRAKMPIPAPRQKKGQSSTGISHLVSSKTHDDSEAGKYKEEQGRIEEYSMKNENEERVAVKGPMEGDHEGMCAQPSVEADEETADSSKSD